MHKSLSVLLALLCASPVLAADDVWSTERGSIPSWAVGAGATVGFASIGGVGAAGLGALTTSRATVSLERRLGGATWLRAGASGFASDSQVEGSTEHSRQLSAGLTLGVGQVLAQTERVALTGFVDVDGNYSRARQSAVLLPTSRMRLYGGELNAGADVDYLLAQGLELRFGTPIIGAGYTLGRVEGSDGLQHDFRQWTANLRLRPELALRVSF
jgi:hypothetical protein